MLYDGLELRETYVHVMAHFIAAFRRPERPNAPHPAPWKAAGGGIWFDALIEVSMAPGCPSPAPLDRLNTLWWVVALLRLRSGHSLRMPVISDVSFASIPTHPVEPQFWTIELSSNDTLRTPSGTPTIDEADLTWVREHLTTGASLLAQPHFSRAIQTLDSARWAHSAGSSLIVVWAALETLFRPGRLDVTKRLAKCIAAFIEQPGPERDRLYQRVVSLYGARGGAAHDSASPEHEQLLESAALARRCFTRVVEKGLPDAALLLADWRATARKRTN